jgi:hypothetical protein
MVVVFIVLVIVGAVLWWLVRLRQLDIEQCRAVLGLADAPGGTPESTTTPEGIAASERVLLQGTLAGRPATLVLRRLRKPFVSGGDRRASDFTVLSITIERPARVALRIQPAGMLGAVETWVRGQAAERVSVDAAFDQAYVVYSDTPTAVLGVLSPAMRERLLAFRTEIAGDLPVSAAGRMASGFVLGTFYLEGTTAQYAAFGSPTKKTAQHVKAAAPVLLELAAAAGA